MLCPCSITTTPYKSEKQGLEKTTDPHEAAVLYYLSSNLIMMKPLRFIIVTCVNLCRTTLGEEQPSTVHVMNNLGLVYFSKRKYNLAETLLTMSLDLQENTLGKGRPNTLTSMLNLGLLYNMKNKHDLAESLYARCYELRRTIQTS